MYQVNILMTTMAPAPLCRLPAELVLQVMRSLSVFDLRAVIAASPGFLRYFLSARRHILQPFITQLKTEMFQNEHLLSRSLLASRLRLLPQTDPFPSPLLRPKLETILQSRPLSPTVWEGSLPILCDLYHQRQESSQLIKEYTTESWDKLSESDPDKLRDWKLRAFQSIFRFILDGYRRLIHEVEDQLCDATSQLTQSELAHVRRFHHRTVHQELLYAVHLSSRGYGLLQNLQNAHKTQLQQFILVSFSALYLHEPVAIVISGDPAISQADVAGAREGSSQLPYLVLHPSHVLRKGRNFATLARQIKLPQA
ncbi:hypothetical protein FDECE_11145 [Fusarium decemcellulare]|nr:hypothetical protein FDECE_11145 [Fusarium decemcellulare]